jgi:hypothetical protein
MSGIFLSAGEVAELTDVRTGRSGRTREQLQIAALKRMAIPFHISAMGRPKVARAIINGGVAPAATPSKWEPSLS